MTRRRFSYANVMSTLAVLLAVSGGAAIAASLPKNSVGKKQLKSNSVVAGKIAAGAVGTEKIAAGAVTTDRIAADAVTGAKADEASFGTVPSAQQADFATGAADAQNAANAQHAQSANTATTAETATTADTAQRAETLSGFFLAQVRSTGVGTETSTDVALAAPQTVISTSTFVPDGGARIVANAVLSIRNNAAAAATASCNLVIAGTDLGVFSATLPAQSNATVLIPLTGQLNQNGSGSHPVAVECEENAGDVTFTQGSLTLVKIPSAA